MDAEYAQKWATYMSRQRSFFPQLLEEQAQPKSKSRRASSRSKKAAPKAEPLPQWPHESPTFEDMAFAGFVFHPTSTSPDNAQCFMCGTQLDGWEENDVPIFEHLTHSPDCGYAINAAMRYRFDDPDRTEEDPCSDKMVQSRYYTFANMWPLDTAAGYPGVEQMVNAGWFFDPNEETPDGVTCPYCGLSLDTWEAGDDPEAEHRKRSPNCHFFALKEFYHPASKAKATRGKRASTRSSTASVSKAAKPPRATKHALGECHVHQPVEDDSLWSCAPQPKEPEAPAPAKPAAKGRRTKKADLEESVLESVVADSFAESTVSTASKAPAKRGRKPKKQVAEESAIEAEQTIHTFAEPAPAPAAKAPARTTRKPKKQLVETTIEAEQTNHAFTEPAPPPAAKAPAKTTRKTKKQVAEEPVVKAELATHTFAEPVASTANKAPAKKGRKPKKQASEEPAVEDEPMPDAPAPAPAKAPPKGRKAKEPAATKRASIVSAASSRITRQKKRTSDEMDVDEAPQPPPKRRISGLSSTSFLESTPRVTPPRQVESYTPATPREHVSSWQPIDIDGFFEGLDLPGDISDLTSQEKKMTVEEWILYNARRGEEKLRAECDRQIAAFEEEGRRALAALDAY